MAADTDHARIVATLTETHEKRLFNTLQTLEERIASLAMSAPNDQGALFDLKWAIDARTDLERIMRETYLTEIDSQVREYQTIVDSMGEMLNEYGDFTGLDPEVVTSLQRMSFQGFEDIAATFTDDLAEELYQSSLTGRSQAESIKNMRQRINGVYIASDQAEIERLVEQAQAGDEAAVRELHQVYAADRTGQNMRRYARQMVFDSAMQFDASINVAAGKEIGTDKWKYYGSVITDTRAWCAKHAKKVLSEEYIREAWAENNWAGKAPGDPFIVRGGYNCRHHFRPAFDFEELDEPEAQEAQAPKGAKVGYVVQDSTNFETGYDRDKFVQALNKLSPSQIALANELPAPIRVKSGRGLYKAVGSQLIANSDQETTIRHEYGHHIDNVLTKHPKFEGMRPVWWSTQDFDFRFAYDKDRKALGLRSKATQREGIKKVWDDIYQVTGTKEVRGRKITTFELKDRDLSGVSDILDSLSQGAVHSTYGGFGHGKSYYSSKHSTNRHLENFANLWALYGSKHWGLAKKHFPNLTKRFEEVMEMTSNG